MSSKREQNIAIRAIGYFVSGLAVYVLLNQFSLNLNFDNLVRAHLLGIDHRGRMRARIVETIYSSLSSTLCSWS
jgi:hypothetical protein